MTTYPIFPTVDSDTKLFPQPTMDALAGALPFASDADVDAVTDTANDTAAVVNDGRLSENALSTTIVSTVAEVPVTDYLAEGQTLPNDGVADASPLIQAALDAAQALATADGARLFVVTLPAGRYRLNTDLNPGGTGQAIRIGIRGTGMRDTWLMPNGDASAIHPMVSPAITTPCSVGCRYADFSIDLINSTHPDPTGASFKGFKGAGWVDCEFENMVVKNSPATAIGTDYPVRSRFQNVHVITTGEGVNGAVTGPTPISAAKAKAGFGLGFGAYDDESVTFVNCSATDCHTVGFFFECQQKTGGNIRNAVITMVGCGTYSNKIGVGDIGSSGLQVSGCRIEDNTYAGVYSGVSPSSDLQSGRDGLITGNTIRRNAVGIYAVGDIVGSHNYTILQPVFGGYRIEGNRIEDNIGQGIVAEYIAAIESGGVFIRHNQIRNNGKAGLHIQVSQNPLRDVVIEGNYFDGNAGAGVLLPIPMNAPRIVGNTFTNSGSSSPQTQGIVFHPAEAVTAPMIQHNTFRKTTQPLVYTSRLDQTLITGNRTVASGDDPDTPARIFSGVYYGGTNTAWPETGDGWTLYSTATPTMQRAATGLNIVTGADGNRAFVHRDFGASGLYVEASIAARNVAVNQVPPVGVAIGMAAAGQTAVIAGTNGVGTTVGVSNFYSLWSVAAGAWTKLWESTIPLTERHQVGLARAAGSTVTNMFIDGVLVHSQDIPAVASTNYAGIFAEQRSGLHGYVSEFRAMTFTA